MNLRSHIRIGFAVTAVWVLFWLLGWPDYYQQYSTRLMAIFVAILTPLFWILVIRMLRSVKSGRIYKSIILSAYFTVPFFVYDYFYCGYYLGNGMGFLLKYWYLTIYYIIPWIMVPLTAVWIESKGAPHPHDWRQEGESDIIESPESPFGRRGVGEGIGMETTASAGPGKSTRGYWNGVPFAAAWILSAMSWFGICSDGCEETHLYRLFGLPLSPFGLGFFTLCGLAYLTRNRFRFSGFLIPVLLSGALGSEFVLIWFQKYVIGKWCLLCVGIALSVVTACALVALERFPGAGIRIRGGERNLEMKRLAGKTVLILFAFLAGMGMTAMGLSKPDVFAAGLPVQSFALGDAESSTEVYIVTDWFCSACRAAEPEILTAARKAVRQAKVVFVDYPIHPETFNFIPFNLSFIVREKAKYLEIREAVATLARKTKEPTPEDVQAAVSPLGVKYVPLNYADVMVGMQYFSTLVKKFKVSGTPSVVVLDSRTGKTKTLNGTLEITSDNILKAVAEASGK